MTIRAKILVTLVAMTGAMLLVGGFGVHALRQRATSLQAGVARAVTHAEASADAQRLVRRVRNDILLTLAAGEGTSPEGLARLDDHAKSFYRTLARMERSHPERYDTRDELRQAFMSYYLFAKQMLAQGDLDRMARNSEVFRHFIARNERLQSAIAAFEQLESETMRRATAEAAEDIRRGNALAVGMIALAVLATALVAAVLNRSLAAPVRDLLRVVRDTQTADDDASAPVRTGDEVGRLSVAFNQMKQRLAENERELAARRSLELMGKLSGAVAHEMNNVLGAIQACLGPASNGGGGAVSEGAAETIRRLCRQGGEFTSQLQRVAGRPEAGPLVTNIAKLWNEFSALAPRLVPRSVALEAGLEPNLPAVQCSSSQLHAVLLNLLLNAVDAMPDGGRLRIAAGLSQTPDGKKALSLRVSDTGPGIPPEDVHRVFEPFYTTKGAGKGTGLGLAVVSGIVRGAGGSVSVDSRPGETTFTVVLPAADQEHGGSGGDGGGAGLAALLVTKDPALESECETLLRAGGYEVLAAPTARDALSLLSGREGSLGLFVIDGDCLDLPREAFQKVLATYFARASVLYLDGASPAAPSASPSVRTADRAHAAEALAGLLR